MDTLRVLAGPLLKDTLKNPASTLNTKFYAVNLVIQHKTQDVTQYSHKNNGAVRLLSIPKNNIFRK